MQSLGEYSISSTISDIDSVEQLLEHLHKCDVETQPSSTSQTIFMLQFIIYLLTLLQKQLPNHLNTLTVICDQLHLMTKILNIHLIAWSCHSFLIAAPQRSIDSWEVDLLSYHSYQLLEDWPYPKTWVLQLSSKRVAFLCISEMSLIFCYPKI